MAGFSDKSKKPDSQKLLAWWFALWGGSLGFIAGAALMAWLGRSRGWWPASEARLSKY